MVAHSITSGPMTDGVVSAGVIRVVDGEIPVTGVYAVKSRQISLIFGGPGIFLEVPFRLRPHYKPREDYPEEDSPPDGSPITTCN